MVLWLAGCPPTPAGSPAPTSSGPAPMDTTGATASTTFIDPDACQSSQDCETEGSCVAPYDPLPQGMPGERGPALCVEPCIEQNDLSQWCIDDASCCGTLRCNAVDGFCEPPGSATDDTGTDTAGSGDGGTTASSAQAGQTDAGSTGGSTSGTAG